MNSRNNIRRALQWQLAERQRHLTDLEALGDRLRADVDRLCVEIDQSGGTEAAVSDSRLDPLFIRPLVDRRDKLLRSIEEIDEQIGEAREAVEAAQLEAKLVDGAMVVRGSRFEDRLTHRARRSI